MPVITQQAATPFFPIADQAAPAPTPSAPPPEIVTVTAPSETIDSGKSFFDNLLDVVNPLEHLPIVSTIYNHITGHTPNDFAQAAGDMLYGGPVGFLSSIGNIAFTHITGKSVGDTVWDWVIGDKSGDASAKPAGHDDSHAAQKPSSDLFSYLRAGNSADATASSGAAAAAPPAAASAPQTAAPAKPAAAATGTPRLLNPLPPRGAVPMHVAPSENVRAAGMASMIAARAHLKTPASESGAPALQPASPVQPTPQAKPVAQQKQPAVSVGSDGIPTLDGNGEQALLDALNKNGISGAIGQQALMAYQKTMAMNANQSNALTPALTVH